jgi:hypothetical protein
MRLKVFIGTTLCALVVTWTLGAAAQGQPPSGGTSGPKDGASGDTPAPPSTEGTPNETVPKDVPPSPPPAVERAPSPGPITVASPGETVSTDDGSNDEADEGPTAVGSVLSPLVVTTGLGYAYAAVSHPELSSHSLSGAFIEVSAGTELERRFRLSLSFTSFETKVRRTRSGRWEEGDYQGKVANGLHTLADPVDASLSAAGGAEVQKTFHAHSVGPRMDFLPLGSQGPYLGMTAAVAIIQDLATRVGADLAARVGGEWRPFQSLGLALEAGAHGQIYTDSKAAIPYALARMTLMLDPASTQHEGSRQTPTNLVMPRALPPPMPR